MKPNLRVLVCDDTAAIRKTIRLTFDKSPGFRVVDEAASGQEAIQKALHLKPDLVLMDVFMPALDGIEATRQILLTAPEIKVLAHSSDSKWETVDRMLAMGAAGYVVKGSDFDELLRAARTVVAGGHYLSRVLLESAVDDR
jgi:DNA-binding NarL/FixJ family response regulator